MLFEMLDFYRVVTKLAADLIWDEESNLISENAGSNPLHPKQSN